MSGFDEQGTVQSMVVEVLAGLGWEHVPADQLDRDPADVLCEDELVSALLRLNPVIAEDPANRIDEVLRPLRALILSAATEGVVAVNEKLMRWLRGQEAAHFVGMLQPELISLIDFDDPSNNRFVVSGPGFGHVGRAAEVQYPKASTKGGSAFDVVLWINGIPVSVGETKTPVNQEVSWLNAAQDIHGHYEARHPAFFASNILSWATEGKEFHYGAVGQPSESWLQWGRTTDPLHMPPLEHVRRSIQLLLTPTQLLSIVRDFTLFDRPQVEGGRHLIKLIPRYPQVEAVEAIVARVADSSRRRGLIWHYQGSGKTLAQAYGAVSLINTEGLEPTIVCVFDRVDLIGQTARQFKTALPDEIVPRVASSMENLRERLASDERGLILTTIHLFRDAPENLNERDDIIVMVDEAHRTTEGKLGDAMRGALPNAQFFGLTGTPVSDSDRNTFKLFGDPDDDDWVLNHYSQARSIKDGTTVPIHVEARLVDWHLDRTALDDAFEELAAEEGLSVEQRELLASRGSRPAVVLSNPRRVEKVVADILEHYEAKMLPSGQKAQVVVYDRGLCVAYHEELTRQIAERGLDHQTAVVMTVGSGKASKDPEDWKKYELSTQEEEEDIKARFRDHADRLRFLVVTAKLLTGFDAPIEGVLYLDKPLRLHTLSQAMARVNRRWTNPETDIEKAHGLIVDYVGLGNEIKKALHDAQPDGDPAEQTRVDVDGLAEEFAGALHAALVPRFDGIDRTTSGWDSLMQAQQRLKDAAARDDFAADMVRVTTLFEFLDPHPRLEPHRGDYRWLVQVYDSVQPSTASNAMLWRKLGPKTVSLVHEHMTVGEVTQAAPEVILDDETIEAIRQLAEQEAFDLGEYSPSETEALTVEDALDTVARRLAALSARSDHPVFKGLGDRLEKLRAKHVAGAKESQDFLQELLELTTSVLRADKAAREGTLDEQAEAILDPRVGALTQIFEEFAPEETPVIVGNVVRDIDQLVKDAVFPGWADSHQAEREVKRELRLLLRDKYGLPPAGELFDRAFAYIAENY